MTSPRQTVRLALTMTWFSLGSVGAIHAQPPEEDPADANSAYTSAELPDDTRIGQDPSLAKAFFVEAVELLKRDQPAMACDKLKQSLTLNPTVGTLLNLGRCHAELGKVVSAHDYYRRAEVLATLMGDTRRQETAHEQAAVLASQRATLSLQIAVSDPSTLEVRIDDVPQPPEIWSRPMFIDAGEHSISIRVPEHEAFLDRVRVQDGVKAVMVVPDLQRLPASPLKAADPASKAGSLVNPEVLAFHQANQPKPEGIGTARTAALVVGGVGVLSLTVGLLFGQLARNADERSQPLCRTTTNVCSPEGKSLRDDALAHASRSTVLSLAGAVAIASGVTLWLVSPVPDAQPRQALSLALSTRGLGAEVRGSF